MDIGVGLVLDVAAPVASSLTVELARPCLLQSKVVYWDSVKRPLVAVVRYEHDGQM